MPYPFEITHVNLLKKNFHFFIYKKMLKLLQILL